MVGLFYYGCWPFSLVAGAAMDRLGPKNMLPIAATAVGIGALLFSLGGREAAYVGRLLQGAGGAFALVGAVYIATKNFPPSRAATLIRATQMFGMAGGSAGQRWHKNSTTPNVDKKEETAVRISAFVFLVLILMLSGFRRTTFSFLLRKQPEVRKQVHAEPADTLQVR